MPSVILAYVTGEGLMPPWRPKPRFGRFRDERYLLRTLSARFASWTGNDAAEGSKAECIALQCLWRVPHYAESDRGDGVCRHPDDASNPGDSAPRGCPSADLRRVRTLPGRLHLWYAPVHYAGLNSRACSEMCAFRIQSPQQMTSKRPGISSCSSSGPRSGFCAMAPGHSCQAPTEHL